MGHHKVFRVSLSLLLAMGVVASSGLQSPADVLRLKDPWKEIDGHVVSVSESQVIIRTDNGDWTTLPRASVHDIRFEANEDTPMVRTNRVEEPVRVKPAVSSAPPVATAPVSAAPVASVSTTTNTTDSANRLLFPDENGKVNDKRFVMLSRFKGQATKNTYAGLYNFSNKGTFWIRLPEPQRSAGELQFHLYGKQNGNQPAEAFKVKARFLDASGAEISQSPQASFDDAAPAPVEWFQLLEGVSGLAGGKEIRWKVPKGTQTIEFRASAATDDERHLVGYLGNLSLDLGEEF